jgi:excisionase family DNA binding protein
VRIPVDLKQLDTCRLRSKVKRGDQMPVISDESKIPDNFPKLLTVDEAAEIVRLRPMTLWGLLNGGKLLRTKVGGKTFIRESELQKLIVDLPLGKTGRRKSKIGGKRARSQTRRKS